MDDFQGKSREDEREMEVMRRRETGRRTEIIWAAGFAFQGKGQNLTLFNFHNFHNLVAPLKFPTKFFWLIPNAHLCLVLEFLRRVSNNTYDGIFYLL